MADGAAAADENMEVIGEDLVLISGDISAMRERLAEVPALIDGFRKGRGQRQGPGGGHSRLICRIAGSSSRPGWSCFFCLVGALHRSRP